MAPAHTFDNGKEMYLLCAGDIVQSSNGHLKPPRSFFLSKSEHRTLYFNLQESEQSDSIALLESDAREDAEEEEVITVEMIDDNIEKTPETVKDDTSQDKDTESSSDHKQSLSGQQSEKQTRPGSETKLFLRRLVGVRDEVCVFSIYVLMYLEMVSQCEWPPPPVYWK